MVNVRKIICDCGEYMRERETTIDHFQTKAMVCPQCLFTTFTKEQAKQFKQLLGEK